MSISRLYKSVDEIELLKGHEWKRTYLPKKIHINMLPYDTGEVFNNQLLDSNMKKRESQRIECENNMDIVSALVKYYAHYDDPEACIHFINNNLWLSDPQNRDRRYGVIPFVLHEDQKRYVRTIFMGLNNSRHVTCIKSRCTGATWVSMAVALYHFLFSPYPIDIGIMANKLTSSTHNTDSLMSKVMSLLRSLPKYYEDVLKMPLDEPTLRKKRLFTKHALVNPNTRSTISIVGGEEGARGRRFYCVYIDEYQFIPRYSIFKASISSISPTIIRLSTININSPEVMEEVRKHLSVTTSHNDLGNDIHDTHLGYCCHMLWYNQPRFTEPVIREAFNVVGRRTFDIEYNASINSSDAFKIIALQDILTSFGASSKLKMNSKNEVIAGLDIAIGDDKTCLVISDNGMIKRIYLVGNDPLNPNSLSMTLDYVYKCLLTHKVSVLYYDAIGLGASVPTYFDTVSRNRNLGFEVVGLTSNNKPEIDYDCDDEDMKFANLKAQLWNKMKLKFQNTREAVESKSYFEDGFLVSTQPHLHGLSQQHFISLPDMEDDVFSTLNTPEGSITSDDIKTKIINHLNMPEFVDTTNSGRLRVTPKKELREILGESTDIADAIVFTCYELLEDKFSFII